VLAAAMLLLFVALRATCNTNQPPSVREVSGPSVGFTGVPVTFRATATDPEGDSIAFQFDWGDTTTPAWSDLVASGETLPQIHIYADPGAYVVRAKAKDMKGRESGRTSGHALSLESHAPAYPDSVCGSVYLRNGGGGCCMSPDGSLLCVGTSSSRESISVIRVSDRTLLPCIRVDTLVGAMVFSNDNQTVYASSWNSGSLYRVDIANGRVVDYAQGIGLASGLAVSPDGSRLLAGVYQNVLVLRTDSLAIIDSVHLPYNIQRMELNRAGTALYVGLTYGVGAVDVQTCSLRMFTPVDFPMYVLLSPDEESLFVYNAGDGGVAELRASDLAVTRRANMGISETQY
jgi:hypothetical protein